MDNMMPFIKDVIGSPNLNDASFEQLQALDVAVTQRLEAQNV